jgi:hypothetical protein
MNPQRPLPITIPVPEALISVESARWALGVDEDSVLALIQLGEIRWAWDIAVHRGGIREIRIWSRCVTARLQGLPQPGTDIAAVTPEVIGVVFRERLPASQVRRILTCSQQHIQRLVASGALMADVARGTRWVDRASFVKFLKSRLIA